MSQNNPIKSNFFEQVRNFLFHPNLFFEKIKNDDGIHKSLFTFLAISLPIYFLHFSLSIWRILYCYPLSGIDFFKGRGDIFFPIPFFVCLIGLILTFIYPGTIHIIVRYIFKLELKYKDLFNVYNYSIIPFFILWPIGFFVSLLFYLQNFSESILFFWLTFGLPIIIFFFSYSFILMIMGLSKIYNITKVKAVIFCLSPLVVIVPIIFGLLINMELFLPQMALPLTKFASSIIKNFPPPNEDSICFSSHKELNDAKQKLIDLSVPVPTNKIGLPTVTPL